MFSENRYPVAGPYSPTPPCIVGYLLDLGKWRGGGGLGALSPWGLSQALSQGWRKGSLPSPALVSRLGFSEPCLDPLLCTSPLSPASPQRWACFSPVICLALDRLEKFRTRVEKAGLGERKEKGMFWEVASVRRVSESRPWKVVPHRERMRNS